MRSLRVRFLLAFALFGALLTYLFGMVAWRLVHMAEDALFERWLDAEADRTAALFAQSPPDAPISGVIHATDDLATLPAQLRAKVEPLDDGAYEFEGDGEIRWNVRVRTLPDARRMYLYVNESEIEASEAVEGQARFWIYGLSGLVALVGLGLGLVTTRQVIAPLRRLTAAVSAHQPDAPPPALRPLVSDDELGDLAHHLEVAIAQVAASARQEQLFGHFTSHELRTSLAVACGAAELLEGLEDPRLQRPLARLDRSLQDMTGIVETCLWLARSGTVVPPSEDVSLRPVVDELVERLARRASPGVTLAVHVAPDVVVRAPRLAVRMVLTNLLSNALRHTVTGRIDVRWFESAIEVADTGPGIAADILARITEPYVRGPGEGHGLGLAIVNGLSTRLGWHFTVESEVGQGTRARLEFPLPE